MTDVVHLTCPVVDSLQLRSLRAGMAVRLSGTLLTARDAAHARLHQLLQASQALPVNLENQALYYVGPAPAAPGLVVGAAGPTTASRM
ncbi:MAG: fumarate hydratase C-terminal domain-containing protein, partial [Sulfobacillus sp.]